MSELKVIHRQTWLALYIVFKIPEYRIYNLALLEFELHTVSENVSFLL